MYFSYGNILWISDIDLENITFFVAAFRCHTSICMEMRNLLKGTSVNALWAGQHGKQIHYWRMLLEREAYGFMNYNYEPNFLWLFLILNKE